MMTWVYAVPLWLAVLIFVGGAILIAGGGLALVQRYIPRDAEFTHNDVAGVIVGSIGTVLAVLLSFMVVTVWQQYEQAATGENEEANALADIYYGTTALPDNMGRPIRVEIAKYLSATINDEWPLMYRGEENTTSEIFAIRIVHHVQNLQPTTSAQANIQSNMIAHVHQFIDQRRARLFDNRLTVPAIIWTLLFFVALLMIALSFFFYVRSARSHMIMTVALGGVIGATFLMIAELDLPFRGPLQLPPHGLIHVQSSLADYRR